MSTDSRPSRSRFWALFLLLVVGTSLAGGLLLEKMNAIGPTPLSLSDPYQLMSLFSRGLGGVIPSLLVAAIILYAISAIRKRRVSPMSVLAWGSAIYITSLLLAATDPEHPKKQLVAAESTQTSEPVLQSSGMTEADLHQLVEFRSKDLPHRINNLIELTRMEAGPGLRVTYHYRFLVETISKDTITSEAIEATRLDNIETACANLQSGLNSGVKYIMKYHAADGTLLFSPQVVKEDCDTGGA